MENMKQVVEAKIASKLQRGASNFTQATERLMKEGKMSRDFLFDVGTERKGISPDIIFDPRVDGRVGGTLRLPTGNEQFTFHPHAVRQVADKLKIPGAYLTSLLMGEEWQRTLAYDILNKTNGWMDRDNILIRAVGSEIRGVLSDSFRLQDTPMIFGSHIEEVFSNSAQMSDGFMDDTRLMVESMLPSPIELITPQNGSVYLAFGTRLSTSDYGDGALELRSFVLQGVCLNGMVRESVLRKKHLGAKLPDNTSLSKETYRLDSMTTSSAIRDYTRQLYSSDVIKNRMLEIQAASSQSIDPVRELDSLQELGKLLKGEKDRIGELLMINNPEDGLQGAATLWKLTQGITAFANDPEVEDRRRMELQEIAGDLFNRIK